MYTLMRAVPKAQLILEHAPALGISLVIAELFYKFGSFTLECVCFLATWFAIDAVVRHVLEAFRTPGRQGD